MRGYWNGIAYMGYIPSMKKYMQFLNENEYREWYEMWEDEKSK